MGQAAAQARKLPKGQSPIFCLNPIATFLVKSIELVLAPDHLPKRSFLSSTIACWHTQGWLRVEFPEVQGSSSNCTFHVFIPLLE